MVRHPASSRPTLVALGVTALYAGIVFVQSDGLSCMSDGPGPLPVLAARPQPAGECAPLMPVTPDPFPAEAPPSAPASRAAARRSRSAPTPSRRAVLGSLGRALGASPDPGARLAILDRGGVTLPAEDRAVLLARALDATPPGSSPGAAAVRAAILERLALLVEVAPARQCLAALVELSPCQEDRLAALRALARGPAPLPLEARSSVRAAARASDPLVALEARALLAVSDRRDLHADGSELVGE